MAHHPQNLIERAVSMYNCQRTVWTPGIHTTLYKQLMRGCKWLGQHNTMVATKAKMLEAGRLNMVKTHGVSTEQFSKVFTCGQQIDREPDAWPSLAARPRTDSLCNTNKNHDRIAGRMQTISWNALAFRRNERRLAKTVLASWPNC